MSRLSEAQDRLEQALARLERASGESDAVRATEVAAEFEIVRARADALEDKTRIVSDRLDAAIGHVRNLLEG